MALNARNFTHHRQLNKGLCGDNGELANRIKDQMKSMLLELSSNKQTSLRAVKQGVSAQQPLGKRKCERFCMLNSIWKHTVCNTLVTKNRPLRAQVTSVTVSGGRNIQILYYTL